MGLDAETKGLRHWAPPQPGDWRARGPWLEGVPAFAAAASGRGPGGEWEGRGAQPGPRLAPSRAGFWLRQLAGRAAPAPKTPHRTLR